MDNVYDNYINIPLSQTYIPCCFIFSSFIFFNHQMVFTFLTIYVYTFSLRYLQLNPTKIISFLYKILGCLQLFQIFMVM
jgi:hypothetical protein